MPDVILTCSEHFTELALNELRRCHPQIVVKESLSPQHLLLKTNCTFYHLTRPWRHKLPIYLHHLFPAHTTQPLTGHSTDLDRLRSHVDVHYSGDYVVQARVTDTYPYTAAEIEKTFHAGWSQSIKPRGRVLSLLIADNCCYMGVSWATQNVSPWATGRAYFKEPVPNRAGLKLLEALDIFEIRLRKSDHALDLGAAPGAWTEVLRRRDLLVTAVAPTEMYDWLKGDSGVQILTMTAEDYLTRCHTTYDLIVNDMRLDARDSARVMVAYAQYLRSQGIAIMTLKLRMDDPLRLMDHAFRLLRKAYKIIRVRQLVSNRKEVTLLLRRKW